MSQRTVAPAQAQGYRFWTDEDRDQLHFLIGQGWSAKRIAAVLGRTVDGVYNQAMKDGGLDHLRHGTFAVRSGRECAALMGVSYLLVKRWIQMGWLRGHRNHARRSKPTGRRTWLIADEALLDFLEVRAAWATWTVRSIQDEDWQEAAATARAAPGGAWHTLQQAAAQLDLSVSGLRKRLHSGWLQAQKIAEVVYVWLPEHLPPFIPLLANVVLRSFTRHEHEMLDVSRWSTNVVLARRASVLLAIADGLRIAVVAALYDCSSETVRKTVHLFNQHGIWSVYPQQRIRSSIALDRARVLLRQCQQARAG